MEWHDIRDPQDKRLEQLAERYQLHPLHIEDCRHGRQNAKVEFLNSYLFVVLKPVELDEECVIEATDLDIFVGSDYVITVQEGKCSELSQLLDRLHKSTEQFTPGVFFHRVLDGLVDMYNPLTDRLSEKIEELEEQALESPQPSTIQGIFQLRKALMELRRILANTRDVLAHLLRTQYPQIGRELDPFFRDVYDHLARNLDTLEVQRDLVNGATELYLTSVANKTNQVMKVLTVFGTIATPALIITGLYGMNVQHLPFAEHPHSWGIIMTIIGSVSGVMLLIFRWMHWL